MAYLEATAIIAGLASATGGVVALGFKGLSPVLRWLFPRTVLCNPFPTTLIIGGAFLAWLVSVLPGVLLIYLLGLDLPVLVDSGVSYSIAFWGLVLPCVLALERALVMRRLIPPERRLPLFALWCAGASVILLRGLLHLVPFHKIVAPTGFASGLLAGIFAVFLPPLFLSYYWRLTLGQCINFTMVFGIVLLLGVLFLFLWQNITFPLLPLFLVGCDSFAHTRLA
jgi:hypothetical protein